MMWPTHAESGESIAFLETCATQWDSGEEYYRTITIKPEDGAVGMISYRVREYAADLAMS